MAGSTSVEKRLIWHPRQDNKFVVGGGSQITLYEWEPDLLEIREVTSQHDLHHMKCFAWSPDPAFDDLIAVGKLTGNVDLFRLTAAKQIRRDNSLPTAPVISLPIRNSRSCKALAFSPGDPNYLAVGLDKARGDTSLMIWDLQTSTEKLSFTPQPTDTTTILESRPLPRIPRPDSFKADLHKADDRVLQAYASSDIVHTLSFLPQSTCLLLAGISHRWLRLFDLRIGSGSNMSHIPSKVEGIATDPFDSHRIACFSENVVTIRDTRHLSLALLTFTEKDAAADGARTLPNSVFSHIEFSSTRRGYLATMEKDANYVRYWDILQTEGETGLSSPTHGIAYRPRTPKRSWTNLPWTGSTPTVNTGTDLFSNIESPPISVTLSNTHRTKAFRSSLASFALVPTSGPHCVTSNVMIVTKEGDLELNALYDTPKQSTWNYRGDFTIGAGHSLQIYHGFAPESVPPPEPWDISFHSLHQPHLTSALTSLHPTRDHSANPDHTPNGGSTTGRRDRGRERIPVHRDTDLFPLLGSTTPQRAPPANLAATRPGPERTFSPASIQQYRYKFNLSVPQPPREFLSLQHQSRHEKSASRVRSTTRRPHHPDEIAASVVEDDLSMIMRQRAIAGYNITHPGHNISVTRNDQLISDTMSQDLPEMWAWINYSKDLLCVPTSRLNGYDFAYEGLLSIWSGLPATPVLDEEGNIISITKENLRVNWEAALQIIAARGGEDITDEETVNWIQIVPSAKVLQRQICLLLCGWSLNLDDLLKAAARWEKEGKYSRAACWLVFTGQCTKAVQLLMRSSDDSHHMMSGTLAALMTSSVTSELKDHCERLIVRLQDAYFRAMITHLVLHEWTEVLEEEVIPYRERLAMAFQFLDDASLTNYLRRTADHAVARGNIDAIMVTGLTKRGIDLLQNYVDKTGDVQTAAILASTATPSKVFPPMKKSISSSRSSVSTTSSLRPLMDSRVERWVETYQDLLDGFKLHHHRVSFDIERGKVISDAMQNGDIEKREWVPRQIIIRCHFCNKGISLPNTVAERGGKPTACPNPKCGQALPRCSICLMTLGIIQDEARETELAHIPYTDTIDDAIVMCQTCRHGGHASHILEWFFGGSDGNGGETMAHGECPVADCNCRCGDEC